jgi:N-acetylglucosaminyldiphosphoundecaprenol N-acetyl-beta-D-mannosaminyltransferase
MITLDAKDQRPRYRMMGVDVDATTVDELHAFIAESILAGRRSVIANHNLHSVYLHHRDAKMRAFFGRADRCHIDGMPLIFIGCLLGYPLESRHRITYIDWTPRLLAEAARRGWRVFYLGSKPGVVDRGIGAIRESFPHLEIAARHGYFDAAPDGVENAEVVAQINRFRPHLLMVGMGMPRQERWILENADALAANVILPCGAAVDYLAGAIPTPPRWTGAIGLEWLFRLASEPWRLWTRYLVEPWLLAFLLTLDCCRRGRQAGRPQPAFRSSRPAPIPSRVSSRSASSSSFW